MPYDNHNPTQITITDTHIHIEGTRYPSIETLLNDPYFQNTLNDSEFTEQFRIVTGEDPKEIVDTYRDSENQKTHKLTPTELCRQAYNETLPSLPFTQFLKELYLSKLILASDPDIARQFIELTVQYVLQTNNEYTQLTGNPIINLTPSIPSDFPHLDRDEWNNAVIAGIRNALTNSQQVATLVLDLVRAHITEPYQHLWAPEHSLTLQQPLWQSDLKLLEKFQEAQIPGLKLGIGLCHDASRFTLDTKSAQQNYIYMLNQARGIVPNLHVQVHLLEQVSDDPQKTLKEAMFFLDLFKKENIRAQFIHMIFLNPRLGKLNETQAIKILEEIIRAKHTITICPSSNLLISGHTILELAKVLDALINGSLIISIGTDDPGPFGNTTMEHELAILEAHLNLIAPNKANQAMKQICFHNS